MNNKVLHITHTNPYKDTRILKIANSLKSKYPLSNQIISGINQEKFIPKKESKLTIISFKLYSKRIPLFFRFFRSIIQFIEFNLRTIYIFLCIRPSFIHCHDLSGLYIGIFAKFFFKTKFIYDAHELESMQNMMSPIDQLFTSIYEYLPILYSDHIFTVSDSISHFYKWKGAKSVSVLFNKPVKRKFNPEKKIRSLLDLNPPMNEGINIIYIGLLVKGRSIEKIIKNFKNKKGFNIYFLGEGPLEELINLTIEKSNNIYLHPFVPGEEVINFIQGFDLSFCLMEKVSLSDYFSLPNKLFESLSAGIPVVSYNIPDVNYIIQKYKIGIVIDSLSNINTFLNINKDTIKEFKENINKSDLDTFWDSEVVKLSTDYSLLGLNKSP